MKEKGFFLDKLQTCIDLRGPAFGQNFKFLLISKVHVISLTLPAWQNEDKTVHLGRFSL